MSQSDQKQLRHVFSVSSGATPASGNAEYWDGEILWASGALDGFTQGTSCGAYRRRRNRWDRNQRHLMKYREPLPPGCSPDAAYEISTAWRVFRLVRANPPTDSDSRSQRAEKPFRRFHGVIECQARGLSVFAARQGAVRALRLPGLRGHLLCSVRLEAGAGHTQQTGRPSHQTWWPLAEFNIPVRCAMVTS